jgi:glycerol-3-phosphate dehydrogenase
MSRATPYDLLVIGGGINGCGIAADAAGRGLSVLLAEADDLACATSSASSKLIHGGLRYLEHYEFRLVREALQEREVLLHAAPHIIWPMRFVLPHVPGGRPAWMIRAGLFLYDHLAARRRIPGSTSVRLAADPAGRVLRDSLERGFCYWDCWVEDSRLVVLNARAAALRGAAILTRSPVTALRRDGLLWRAQLGGASAPREVAARAVVNAAGPWTADVARMSALSGGGSTPPAPRLRLVRGSHIVVPRIRGANDAFLLQSPDGRVVFALPFEGIFTLIGTTDVPHAGDPRQAVATPAEIDYLLSVVNAFLARPLRAADVVWSFAGVRPLDDADGIDNPSSVTRDWRLELDTGDAVATPGVRPPPIVHVIGGKITTYRRLAEAAMDRLAPYFPGLGPAWTAHATLPGGMLGGLDLQAFSAQLAAERPRLPSSLVDRLVRRHGSDTADVLGDSVSLADLGAHVGGSVFAREVAYFAEREWARHPDDILWRRTRAGLHIPAADRTAAAEHIASLL